MSDRERSDSEARLSFASYNVHRCVGRDARHDPERIAHVLGELSADVVALQEVDSREGGEGGVDQFEVLARATGYRAIAGPTLRSHRGHYGNALLTHLPVLEVRRVDLTVAGREPRGALDVLLEHARAGPLRVIATHLGLGFRERRDQVKRLLELLDRPEQERLLVVLGDVNEWLPRSLSLHGLRRRLGPGSRARTFPSRRPVFALDRIWVLPSRAVTRVRCHASPLARMASDHLPLRAEVRVDATSARTRAGSP
jgi:endonuclease/exonuclease/phosphatase family metal-dependent hydrolase